MTTIFAPTSTFSGSSIVTIRISGEKSMECAQKLGFILVRPNMVQFVKIKHNNQIIDEALAVYFKAPHSFTGQDIVEISIHASIYIYNKISEILMQIQSVRLAEPGEFSKIAFLNNKLDLIQAEAIIDLIKSETSLQHKQAIKQISGQFAKIYDELRDKIIEILALIESIIDFPDEDLPKKIIDLVNEKVLRLKNEIRTHLEDKKRGQKIKEGLELVIIGAPNVGKSSLINYLTNSHMAIISDIAGTTRDILEANLDIAGVAVRLIDTAGIRKSENIIEKEGIKRAILRAKKSDLVLYVDDLACNFNKEILNDLYNSDFSGEVIKIFNKLDIAKNQDSKEFDVAISLKEKTNLDKLNKLIKSKVKKIIPDDCNFLITRQRHRKSLESAFEALENFNLEMNIELASEELRHCANEIAKITGRINVDDVLDAVFSKFCIGK